VVHCGVSLTRCIDLRLACHHAAATLIAAVVKDSEIIVANHQDAIKRAKQNVTRRIRNRHYRTQLRNHTDKVRSAVEAGDKDAAGTAFRGAVSIIHRVAAKGIIHRNQAARRISRLNAAVKAL
jgi:small subunit ribosomal protein S20